MTGAPPGRNARHPRQFRWRDWRQILGRVWARIGPNHLSILASGVAFWGLFAIFPGIAALISLYGLVADPAAISQHLEAARPLLPAAAFDLLEVQVSALIQASPSGLGLASAVALGLALWSSRAGVAALMEGLNVVYEEEERRNYLVFSAVSLVLTFVLLVLTIAAMISVVAVPALLRLADLGPLGVWLAPLLPWSILTAAVVFAIGAVYRYGPCRATARKRWVTLGAVTATALWVTASLLFSWYVANFADYNKLYGSLGAIIILLLWLYISAFVVLLGGELNAEMELHTERDTTVGPTKPMGERGAYVADHVA